METPAQIKQGIDELGGHIEQLERRRHDIVEKYQVDHLKLETAIMAVDQAYRDEHDKVEAAIDAMGDDINHRRILLAEAMANFNPAIRPCGAD